jgi:hypothetical protein
MVRPLIGFSLSLVILFGILTLGSTVIGSFTDPPVVVALVSLKGRGYASGPPSSIALYDLSRLLRINHPIPFKDIVKASLIYPPVGRVTVSTYYGNTSQKTHRGSFYHYDYVTGGVEIIDSFESDEALIGGVTEFHAASSPDGRNLAFINPLDRRPYLYEVETGQKWLLADLSLQLAGSYVFMSWSHDGQRLLIYQSRTIYILNLDGNAVQRIRINSDRFYPIWSPDSQYIFLSGYQASDNTGELNQPIKVIDVMDGSEHPLTKGLVGRNPSWWGCDGRWLTYVLQNGQQSEGYLLNIHSGEHIRVNDDPLLADENIDFIRPSENCKQFFIYGQFINTNYRPMYPMYLFDLKTKKTEHIGNEIAVVQFTEDSQIYYEQRTPDTERIHLFRRGIVPLGSPIFMGEYSPPTSGLNWWRDMSFAIFTRIDTQVPGNQLYFFDLATQRSSPLIAVSEMTNDYFLLKWSDLNPVPRDDEVR